MTKKKNKQVSEYDATNLQEFNLKGKVWQVKQSMYLLSMKRKGLMECKYDPQKYLKNVLLTFNEKGNLIEKAYYDFRDGIYKDTYNDDGEHVSCNHYDLQWNLNSSHVKEYDKNGFLHKNITYDKDNNLKDSTVLINDENGAVVEYYSLNAEGKKKGRQTFINNSEGNKIDQTIYKNDGTFDRRMQYKYNEHGHTTETKYLNEDGTVLKIETTVFEYDANGNITCMNGIKYKHDSSLETYKYEYDRHGNWIRQVEFYKGIPTAVAIREINYFGEEAKEKMELSIIPLTGIFLVEAEAEKIKKGKRIKHDDEDDDDYRNENSSDIILTDQERQWITEVSRPGEFNAKRFYIAAFKDVPSEIQINQEMVEVMALLKQVKDNMDAYELFSGQSEFTHSHERLNSYAVGFPGKPYILHATQINPEDKNEYDASAYVSHFNSSSGYFYCSPLALYIPGNGSGKRDMDFEYSLQSYIELCTIEPIPDQPEIYMVEVTNNSYELKSHPVNDNFEIKDLDVNYGAGFEKFHNQLMQRFESETQGLVLFHGEPGTGKTFYIRHLLRKMASKNKKVIYMPPNMVDHLVDPVFMTFLTRTITRFSASHTFCVLLIEDAEPLLASRNSDTRIQGVTNLLNMTDGLLNDMLKLQIICTFNVELKKIDKALLRPGRLVARKEFKPLSVLDANLLTQRLGIKHHFTKEATLGEIYALRKNKNTLIHDVEPDKGSSTFIDDLI